MLIDLLLSHGFFLGDDPKELQIMKPDAPLGILYLASHLRARGFSVEVFDTTFSSWPELQGVLASARPAVLDVYANLKTRGSVVRILRAARDLGWRSVAGGPEPGAYAKEYLAAGADVVVIGEGEVTLEELLPILQGGSLEQLSKVNGIAFCGRMAGSIVLRRAPRFPTSTGNRGPAANRFPSSVILKPGASIMAAVPCP